MDKTEVNVIAYGAGVQTTALAVASVLGDYHTKPHLAVFGDPQWELPETYESLKFYSKFLADHGVPLLERSRGGIRERALDPEDKWFGLPVFTKSGVLKRDGKFEDGRIGRKCTRDYKIDVVGRAIRSFLGFAKGEVVRGYHVNIWLGISTDESHRMKDNPVHWQTSKYPLIEMGWSRSKCVSYLESKGLPVPPKSACIGCPFHNNQYWRDLKKKRPNLFDEVCEFDDKIRRLPPGKNIKSELYLHRSLRPLRDADLEEGNFDLFGEECEGHCGL